MFPSEPLQTGMDPNENPFLVPSTPPTWTHRGSSSTTGKGPAEEHQSMAMRNPFGLNHMGAAPDLSIMTRAPATSGANVASAGHNLSFDTRTFEPRAFDKPWLDVSSVGGGSSNNSPMGFGDDRLGFYANTWSVTQPPQQQQLQSPLLLTETIISAAQNPPSGPADTRLVQRYGMSRTASPFVGPSSSLGTGQATENPSTVSLAARRRHPSTNPNTPIIIPQDRLLPNLKACFYSLLPPRDRAVDHPLLAQLQQYQPHDVLVGSLHELGRFASSQQPLRAPFKKLCFAYLAFAMARTLEDYINIQLPGNMTARMEGEINNHLLSSPESAELSQAFMVSTNSFLDLFQVYLKQELRSACDLSCQCALSPDSSLAIQNSIRAQFPSVQIPDADQGLPPMQCHRTARSLELDLLRLSPGKLPTAPNSNNNQPELSVEDFFESYIPAVRRACSPYYCQHLTRAKYHVWVIRLIWHALGAQEDAPLRSQPGGLAGGMGPPRHTGSSMSVGPFGDAMHLEPRSPVPVPGGTVDRATSPAPMKSPVSQSDVAQKDQGLACPERSCHYVALGNNAKKLLKRHKDALHNPDKQRLPCRHCDKNFTRKDNLKAHIMKKHAHEENAATLEDMDEDA
ncbi:hypothetical protein MKZ38_009613 [Zalerion maritima]|uniref:C2H2-type domain-containing protein n=1 Tax=Zalerion maritima TaxID=339359 RepID=A0AAD5RGQ3_9PEZI|nr:hypothetical protein MKZ38_009613 [Zalerion maritima]